MRAALRHSVKRTLPRRARPAIVRFVAVVVRFVAAVVRFVPLSCASSRYRGPRRRYRALRGPINFRIKKELSHIWDKPSNLLVSSFAAELRGVSLPVKPCIKGTRKSLY